MDLDSSSEIVTIEQKVEQVYHFFDPRSFILLVLSASILSFSLVEKRSHLTIWRPTGSSTNILKRMKKMKVSMIITWSQWLVFAEYLNAPRSWSSTALIIKSIKTKMMRKKSRKCSHNTKKTALFTKRNSANWPFHNFSVLLIYSSIKSSNLSKKTNLQPFKDSKLTGTWSRSAFCKKVNQREG